MADNITALMKANVGLAGYSSGENIPTMEKSGALHVQPYGKYYAVTKAGKLFHATTTTLAGLAPGTDGAGTAATLVLHNPSNSGLDAVILEGRVSRGSTGDIGPGTIYWMMETDSTLTVPSGTDATVVNGYVGAGDSNKMRVLYSATIQATNPRPIRVAAALFENAIANIAAGVQSPAIDDVGGSIIVPPGVWVGLMGHTNAGASPLVVEGITYLQVPV